MAFTENTFVKEALERGGQEALPLTLVDGHVVLSGRYPTREELKGWISVSDSPSIFSPQVAELVALSASIAANCEPCFKFHYTEAKKLGVSPADMRRAVDLAQKVKDAPARAVLDLAKRMIDPAAAPAGARLAAIAVKGAPVGSCCGPSSQSGPKEEAKCC